jgi:hypothetical protein
MARYVGLDVHKHSIEVCALDAKGKVVFRGRTGCLRPELEAFARAHLKKTDHVALEATTNTWAVVDVLRPFVADLVVGDPPRTRAIAEAKVKTDKVDAEVLAQLRRCDYLPTVWQPDVGQPYCLLEQLYPGFSFSRLADSASARVSFFTKSNACHCPILLLG